MHVCRKFDLGTFVLNEAAGKCHTWEENAANEWRHQHHR